MSCHQEELGISPKTVEKYDEHIKIKLGYADAEALEAAEFAQEQAYALLIEAIGEAKDSKVAMLVAVHTRTLDLRLRTEGSTEKH
jgi:hypothetical protein